VNRPALTATLGVPCAAMWYDPRALGRPRWRYGTPAGTHDGWRTCTTTGTDLIDVDGTPRRGVQRARPPDPRRDPRWACRPTALAPLTRWRNPE